MPEFINSQEFLYANLLKTGQTTQYNSELDDGYYEKGLGKIYQILTTGSQSGTTNIDLAHYTGVAGEIDFVAATQKITDVSAGLVNFLTGDVILTDDPNNPGPFTIATGGVAAEIVCAAGIINSTPAGAITIYKREAHSNNIVVDLRSDPRFGRRMWSRYISDKMGVASDGKMPWTGQPYDIYAYCAAANAAELAGYSDWRIPNKGEFDSIADFSAPTGNPDSTAFPVWPDAYLWNSTTAPNDITKAETYYFAGTLLNPQAKTTALNCILVRGG